MTLTVFGLLVGICSTVFPSKSIILSACSLVVHNCYKSIFTRKSKAKKELKDSVDAEVNCLFSDMCSLVSKSTFSREVTTLPEKKRLCY